MSGEDEMKKEIFLNGPAEASFVVYSDFLTYKSGILQNSILV